jgi:hypothetical protein
VDIELGNEAMRTATDVVLALRDISWQLQGGARGGWVRDRNGNSVGDFRLVSDDDVPVEFPETDDEGEEVNSWD